MEFSPEIIQLIIQHINRRSDLYALTLTSKAFQRTAERALYNTLTLKGPATTVNICRTLASNPRLGSLIDAMTIFVPPPQNEGETADNGNELPGGYWQAVASALRSTTRLKHFNIHVEGDTSFAWILRDSAFRLRSFHCDLAWDSDLVDFLNSQDQLRDIYLADFPSPSPVNPAHRGEVPRADSIASSTGALREDALPELSILECSFIEAIVLLVPGRPVRCIKTCFSHEDTLGKTEELRRLAGSLQHSSATVCSLDLADASYTEEFSLTVLRAMAHHVPDLRYFGTLVLPIGLERLQFFGLLMRLRSLDAIELEVSEWEPAPNPQAMRALASEVRLYCPSIECFVFVQEFERTIVRVTNGRLAVDLDATAENLWRRAA